MLVCDSVLYHTLTILLYRPSLASNNMELASLAAQTCSSASKKILAILALYECTFPYRLMTYQVSYCVFTAATAQAYIMRHSDDEPAKEAAKILSSAMCILQHETKHTPGISGSLDTLRKQLMMGKPVRRSLIAATVSAANQPPRGPPNPQSDVYGAGATPNNERSNVFDNRGLNIIDQPGIDISDSTYQGNVDVAYEPYLGIGGIDTGAGFHPSVFPWTSIDWLNTGEWLGCG